MTTRIAENWRTVIMCMVCLVTFFANNQVITPDIMESRNIITAREMVYEGHWLVPTMNGDLRLEKPPLPTWLTALAEMASPDSLPLQRGMAGLAAILLVMYFWKTAKHVLHIDPFVPSLLLCTCYNVILMGRTASWDIYCHALMMGGIYHLAKALQAPPCAWGQFLLAGIYTGLSIMSKGPVSLYALFLPFLISFLFYYRPQLNGKITALIVMAILAVLIGGWWYAYVHWAQADALKEVVQKESGSWINHNVRPWWYYWKFFLETGVWSLLLITAMFLPLQDHRRRNSRPWLFAMGWMLASLLLLSLLPEKKSRYLLPLLIPASDVMGCMMIWWNKVFRNPLSVKSGDKWCFRLNTMLIMLAVAALPVAAWRLLVHEGFLSMEMWTICLAFVVLTFIILCRAYVKLRPMSLLGGVTLLFMLAECFVMPSLANIINNPDMKSIAATRKMRALDNIPFYHIDTVPLRIEMVYAAHRNIRPLHLDTLQRALPCVLLTHQPMTTILPQNQLRDVETTYLGCFDDNRRPKGNRRYSPQFIYHATLLKTKGTAE